MSAVEPLSYYAASANPRPDRPALAGDAECDVCVVGGGLTGCSAALELAERGYRVVLLEARSVGWGASGRSGGQVIFGYACGQERLAQQLPPEDLRRAWAMSVEAVELVKARIARHAIACDWRDGQLHAAIKPRQERELRDWQAELERDYGYQGLEWWDRGRLGEVLGSRRYLGGLYDARCGHLHPLNYTLGVAAAAEAAGAVLHEASPVLELSREGDPLLRTPSGRVRARHVVLAGNAWLGRLAPRLRRRIMPVGTYIGATSPLGAERARSLIANGMAVTDVNFVLDYFRLSADDRLLFGGRVSYSTLPPPGLARAMRASMLRVFPQLADVHMDYAWGGLVDITLNRAPDFGRLAPDVYYAQGFSGHGMALTGLAGRLMAEAIAGTAERFDLFTRLRHRDFPGGPLLRTPALVLAMLYYRLRDML